MFEIRKKNIGFCLIFHPGKNVQEKGYISSKTGGRLKGGHINDKISCVGLSCCQRRP